MTEPDNSTIDLGTIYTYRQTGKSLGYQLNVVGLGDDGVKIELVHDNESEASVILPPVEVERLKLVLKTKS